MQESPATAGIELANWNWKVVHRFVWDRWSVRLSHSSCLNYLHRLGLAFRRPKKGLVETKEGRWEAFVAEYTALREEAEWTGAKIFFLDEAHFRAEAELQGKWVLKGEPAPVKTGAGFGGLHQSEARREGQLLFCGVLGDR